MRPGILHDGRGRGAPSCSARRALAAGVFLGLLAALPCPRAALASAFSSESALASPGELLDRLDRALWLESPGGLFRTDLGGLFDLEGYFVDQRPPGLIFGGEGGFVNPRLSLFLDTRLGSRLYSFVRARIDRGFDPRAASSSARFDEYFLRYTPFERPLLHLQIGKFATVAGNWVPRHDSWQNPFINAPLPYENVTIVSDSSIAPTPEAFLARRTVVDRKDIWVPVVWGPGYASGVSVFGRVRDIDYAAEVKNASLSSRPSEWDGRSRDGEHPSAHARVGWNPHPAWAIGASYGDGPYLRKATGATLPAGTDAGDFRQRVAAADARYAWRYLELWGELFLSRFEVPNVGDADTLAGYVEGRYKLTPRLFAALRANLQLFGEVTDSAGRDRRWDRDVWRLDHALTWRFDRHLQAKVQYSYMRQSGGFQQGEQLVAGQLTVAF